MNTIEVIQRVQENDRRKRRAHMQAEVARIEAGVAKARKINQANRAAAHKIITRHYAPKFTPLSRELPPPGSAPAPVTSRHLTGRHLASMSNARRDANHWE